LTLSDPVSHYWEVARRIPPQRITEIAKAAFVAFEEKGYRHALMSDVADALGLSHGLLYRYVESKEALFSLAVRLAVRPDTIAVLELPIPTSTMSDTIEMITDWLRVQTRLPTLTKARRLNRADDIREEFSSVVEETYDTIARIFPVLSLVERCALDLPDLHSAYFVQTRRSAQKHMADYLRSRIGEGQMRSVPNVMVAARFVAESVAWFAWHRKGDPDSAMITDDDARETVKHLLVEAFCETA